MSLFEDFTAAVDAAIAERCHRTHSHGPHDTTDGHCPGHHNPTLPADQVSRLADTVRKEIRHG